jgi:hypothetical protein
VHAAVELDPHWLFELHAIHDSFTQTSPGSHWAFDVHFGHPELQGPHAKYDWHIPMPPGPGKLVSQ